MAFSHLGVSGLKKYLDVGGSIRHVWRHHSYRPQSSSSLPCFLHFLPLKNILIIVRVLRKILISYQFSDSVTRIRSEASPRSPKHQQAPPVFIRTRPDRQDAVQARRRPCSCNECRRAPNARKHSITLRYVDNNSSPSSRT
jgi:hypothetical protein